MDTTEFTTDIANEVFAKLKERIDSQQSELDALRAENATKTDEVCNFDCALRVKESELTVKNEELNALKKELDAKNKELEQLARDSCELRRSFRTSSRTLPTMSAPAGSSKTAIPPAHTRSSSWRPCRRPRG